MEDTKRVLFTLSTEAIDALRILTTPRKQGEYVSKLLLDALAGKGIAQPGILERIEAKLDAVLSKRV